MATGKRHIPWLYIVDVDFELLHIKCEYFRAVRRYDLKSPEDIPELIQVPCWQLDLNAQRNYLFHFQQALYIISERVDLLANTHINLSYMLEISEFLGCDYLYYYIVFTYTAHNNRIHNIHTLNPVDLLVALLTCGTFDTNHSLVLHMLKYFHDVFFLSPSVVWAKLLPFDRATCKKKYILSKLKKAVRNVIRHHNHFWQRAGCDSPIPSVKPKCVLCDEILQKYECFFGESSTVRYLPCCSTPKLVHICCFQQIIASPARYMGHHCPNCHAKWTTEVVDNFLSNFNRDKFSNKLYEDWS